MNIMFQLAFLLLLGIVITSTVVFAAMPDDIIVQRYRDPTQKNYAYAGKLYWDQRHRRWQKKVVIYNNEPMPANDHPVWGYVQNLQIPRHAGVPGRDKDYKRFYRNTNCTSKTPLADGRPWFISFDRLRRGQYTAEALRKDWHCPEWQMGQNLINVVNGRGAYRGNALRIHYPRGIAGCYSPKHCVNWKPDLGGKFKKLYYGYRFKFPPGFDFVKGGKLPGVGGGESNTNGAIPNGADGWSVRMMWDKEGKLVQYVYHPDQPGKYGEGMAFDMKPLQLGKWHTVQTMVLLNTPGQRDGAIKTWLNGKVVMNRQGLRFRNVNRLEIDRLLFSSFFGGSGPYWAPRRDQYAFIDDVRISQRPVFFTHGTRFAGMAKNTAAGPRSDRAIVKR